MKSRLFSSNEQEKYPNFPKYSGRIGPLASVPACYGFLMLTRHFEIGKHSRLDSAMCYLFFGAVGYGLFYGAGNIANALHILHMAEAGAKATYNVLRKL